MAGDFEEQILERYRDELVWLRRMGSRFAKRYPRVARRLELSDGPSPDPHVERLLEGVAFLTARLQHNLEAELPDITAGLLAAVYPHFFQPIPSMAIAQLEPDDGGAGMTTGLPLPRHMQLYCETSFEKRTCRWRTAFPMTLWPIVVEEAVWESPAKYAFMGPTSRTFSDVRSVLRLRLHSNTEPFHNLKIPKLRFFLDGEPRVTGALYEMLTTQLHSVVSFDPKRVPGRNDSPDRGGVEPVGFSPDETVLPTTPHGLRGYALLQEYFALPEKFLFVEMHGLKSHFIEQDLDVLICFGAAPRRKINVTPDTFRLGCTPIVNLFEKISEPIYVEGDTYEYLLNPDARWERTTEVHQIKSMKSSIHDDNTRLEPLYGLGHRSDEGVTYYDVRRRPARNQDLPGTDVWVSFVDAHLHRKLPQTDIIRARLVCTNRDLAQAVDEGERLHIEDGPHAVCKLITRPTKQLSPPTMGETLWKLVSHLALSHIGLPEGEGAVEALQEQLRLYAFTTEEPIEPQLQAIEDVSRETVALRADDESWRGFVRVQRITVTLNEDRFQGISPILLGHVLHAYFGLHSSVNVFTQLALVSRQRDGVWKLWPPMIPSSKDG